jgi:hypothetical protein
MRFMRERCNPASKHNFLKGIELVRVAGTRFFGRCRDSGQRDKPKSFIGERILQGNMPRQVTVS